MGFWGRPLACARALGVAALAMCASVPDAAAQSRTCRDLEARLSALPSRASSAQVGAYDRAIARQNAELGQARANARRCGGLFANNAQCRSLNATIVRMVENLADLKRKRSAMDGGGGQRQRGRLLAALDAEGCRGRATAKKAAPREEPAKKAPPQKDVASAEPPQPDRPSDGAFRTMCVRLCDGYYFPISFAVPSSLFTRDAQVCEARCPGAKVDLYVHRVQKESETMVSAADGSPYRDLDRAFVYRRTRTPGCGCQAPAPEGFSVLAGEQKAEAPDDDAGETRFRAPAPEASSIEELGEARENGEEATEPQKRVARPRTPADRRVRIVGPESSPDSKEAADPQAPAPTPDL